MIKIEKRKEDLRVALSQVTLRMQSAVNCYCGSRSTQVHLGSKCYCSKWPAAGHPGFERNQKTLVQTTVLTFVV